ncbi:hypothetical protein ACP26L_09115 [Paenibacillus sp. S-38]|uniref:hypothetical protein n=1 Tax=Paenibacillus sp. S-38 TaxID=3416710 RepID=UPI003CE900EA
MNLTPTQQLLMEALGRSEDGKIHNGAEYLLKTGLLFEINRRILHPLGLAMRVVIEKQEDGTSEYSFAPYLFDNRDNEVGELFDEDTLRGGEQCLLEFMEDFGVGKMQERLRHLGFIIQRSQEPVRYEHI